MTSRPLSTRRVWQQHSFGALTRLALETVPFDTSLQRDEVLIRVTAIGLNYADIFTVLGLYEAAVKEKRLPFVPGLEFAGVVEESGGPLLTKGQRVYGFRRFGAFGDRIVQKAAFVRSTPDHWTDAEAASFVVQYMTAWYALVDLGNCKKGSKVLVHSAAGGVGLAALHICNQLKAEAVAVVGNDSKVSVARNRGGLALRKVIVRPSKTPDSAYLRSLDDCDGFDVVLDSLGARFFDCAFDRLRPMGRIIHFGATNAYGSARDGVFKWPSLAKAYLQRPKVDPGILTSTNRAVMGFNLIWLCDRIDDMTRCLDALITALEGAEEDLDDANGANNGDEDNNNNNNNNKEDDAKVALKKIQPPHVGKTFPFHELPDALRYLQSGLSTGKVVVLVE